MSLVKKLNGAKFKVTFTFESSFAKKVQLLGDFNAWDASTAAMKSAKGVFSKEIELPANSSFQFRYLIDGQAWDNDSKADYYVDSPFSGIQNSVVVLESSSESKKPSNATTVTAKNVETAPKKAAPAAKATKVAKPATAKKEVAKNVVAKKEVAKKVVAKKVESAPKVAAVATKVAKAKAVKATPAVKATAKVVVTPKKKA